MSELNDNILAQVKPPFEKFAAEMLALLPDNIEPNEVLPLITIYTAEVIGIAVDATFAIADKVFDDAGS